MKYTINQTSETPAYLQLYHQLRTDITKGHYTYDEKLPSKRLLAQETGTSVITVEHTYDILREECYIDTKERRVYFVTYKPGDFFSVPEETQKPQPLASAYKTTTITPEEDFPFTVFAKTMRNVITKYGKDLYIKSPNLGSPVLQKSLCRYLARSKGIEVKPEQIVIGSGAEYLYGLIVQLLGWENIEYAIEDPSYKQILSVYTANGVKCDKLKMGTDGILSSELAGTKAKVLHVTPFRSYPTGITASASKRAEYIAWAQERKGFIIEDDFDSEFTISSKHEDTLFSLEPTETVIYLNTFSHTIAPSMRIGYMVLPSHLVDLFIKKIGFYSCTVPVFEQYLLAELINTGDFERHINRVRRIRRTKGNATIPSGKR